MNSENDESSTSTSSSPEGSSGGPPGPSIHAVFVLDQFSNGVEMMRCSMPSLSKMPSAARQLVSNMLSFLSSPSPQNNVSEKGASFSTPQANRKNKVNGSRRMSDSNNVAYSNGKAPFEGNIEKWEPNVYEKELLRRTWSDEFDNLYELGSAIYCYIFDHNPNCKQLFPFISKYQGDEWKESKEFRSQALKFVQTLAQVVKNIYHMERTESFLYTVGQKHVKFADRGFKHEYWDIFQDAMEFALEHRLSIMTDLDDNQKKDAVTVWRTLALYTTVHMRNGFIDGLKGVNRFPPLV
ncbi:hypothetical protein L3Y34_015193 [Caenorhabditis briggsae]|uniref:Globin domain-containing protein n=1 Tax=Caenorhabditis briggsae TaxID=6238 RepID=A0AAE9DVY6_CAEBR|nr:hypothetical protein L3Y34_015193 [Caenorhabditis briggsae]